MRIIIGIDPGLASTGYGIIGVENNRYRHLTHGTIHTAAEQPLAERLFCIYQELIRICETYHPGEAGVESLFFAKNIKTAIPVAHARGAILTALASLQVGISEYTPLVIKQNVVGKGRAEKKQVQLMVKILLALDKIPAPDHAADALAVAICHSHYADFYAFQQKGS